MRPPSLRERVEDFVTRVVRGESPHLILTGEPGIGKTHLGVGIYRAVVFTLGTLPVILINVPKFCDEVKASYGKDYDPFDEYREASRLVVLDDLFGRDLSPHEIDQVVYRLIDIAYQNNAAIFLNMNNEVQSLATFLRPHEVSRLLQESTIIPVKSSRDWRRT